MGYVHKYCIGGEHSPDLTLTVVVTSFGTVPRKQRSTAAIHICRACLAQEATRTNWRLPLEDNLMDAAREVERAVITGEGQVFGSGWRSGPDRNLREPILTKP